MTARKPDTRIVNHGRGHSYQLDGEKVDGVTRALDGGYPKKALIGWAADESGKYVLNHWDELVAMEPAARYATVRDARFIVQREASERGQEVHTQVVRYLHRQPVVPPEGLEGHVDHAIRFVEEWGVREVAVEAPCFSRAFRYGGRLDLLAELADGRLWLLDFKTNLKGIFLETILQLAAYRYAEFYVLEGELDEAGQAVEHPMPPVDATGVVWVRADGYDLVPVDSGPEAFVVFGAVQEVAGFATSQRDDWIGDALRPPVLADDPELLAADGEAAA
jgi:hypothetical protein